MSTTTSTPAQPDRDQRSDKAIANPPPLVLTITLHTDGTGTVLTAREQLGSLMAFQYTDINDIMQAIQAAANHLIAIEQQPPVEAKPAEATRPAVPTPTAGRETIEPQAEPAHEPEQQPRQDSTPITTTLPDQPSLF
jgi:uncharacterized membrane protein